MAYSLVILYQYARGILSTTYEISDVICSIGKDKLNEKISFSSLIQKLTNDETKFDVFSFDGILSTIISISSFTLVITFATRYILTKVLIMLSPFAILCLMNKSTAGIFKSWLKSFASLLLIQIVLAIILLIPFAILKDHPNDIFAKLLMLGSVYALLKSTQFVKDFINGTGISTDFNAGISGLRSIIGK